MNAGLGPFQFSGEYATSGDTKYFSLQSLGPGAGESVDYYQTNTFVSDNLFGPYSDNPDGGS